MIHEKATYHDRQDSRLMKLTLGFLMSPLIILVAFATAVSI